MADSHFQVSCNGPPEAEIGTQKTHLFWTNWGQNREEFVDMIYLLFHDD